MFKGIVILSVTTKSLAKVAVIVTVLPSCPAVLVSVKVAADISLGNVVIEKSEAVTTYPILGVIVIVPLVTMLLLKIESPIFSVALNVVVV